MRIKVLPLEEWQKRVLRNDDEKLIERDPIFNRDGWYVYNNLCWFEYDGRAYQSNKKQFLYNLSLENHCPLRSCESNAISLLMKSKLANQGMRDLYFLDGQWKSLRDVYRNVRKYMMKVGV